MIFYSKRFIWLISCLAVILWIVNAFKDYRKCGYKRTFELQALLSRRKAKQVSSSPTIQDIGNDLCAEKVLSDTEILRFARDGHIFSKDLLDVDFISYQLYPSIQSAFKAKQLKAMQHLVQVVTNDVDALPSGIEECQDILRKAVQPSDIPFLQLFHLWREHDVAKRIACSPALGKIAAQLLGVPAVRLYQDSLFVKRPGDGPTEWHSDLNMAPLDTNSYITCWIPLHNVPRGEDGGSGLAYGTGSHRDFSLLYWHGAAPDDALDNRYDIVDHGAYQVGDCSWHHGWCLHCAPGNDRKESRWAYSVSFVAADAKTLDETVSRYPDDEDYHSYADWIEGVGWGNVINHKLLPVVYDTKVHKK